MCSLWNTTFTQKWICSIEMLCCIIKRLKQLKWPWPQFRNVHCTYRCIWMIHKIKKINLLLLSISHKLSYFKIKLRMIHKPIWPHILLLTPWAVNPFLNVFHLNLYVIRRTLHTISLNVACTQCDTVDISPTYSSTRTHIFYLHKPSRIDYKPYNSDQNA